MIMTEQLSFGELDRLCQASLGKATGFDLDELDRLNREADGHTFCKNTASPISALTVFLLTHSQAMAAELKELREKLKALREAPLDIVFTGAPGPGPEDCRFVETEIDGHNVHCGDWFGRDDGLWTLRIYPSRWEPSVSGRGRERD